MDIDKSLRKFALQNAVRFQGKASGDPLIGCILREFPEWRKKPKELSRKAEESVKKVNLLRVEEQRTTLGPSSRA